MRPGKPCQSAPGSRRQHAGSRRSSPAGASAKATRSPVAGSVTVSGCHTPKNHPGRSPASAIRRPVRTTAWRKRIASLTASSISHSPCGPSIMAVATSREAIAG
ncbi:hypothetical protein SGLAM104S_03046 [Streptomyces glaucescens]